MSSPERRETKGEFENEPVPASSRSGKKSLNSLHASLQVDRNSEISQNPMSEWAISSKALAERLSRSGMAFLNGNLVEVSVAEEKDCARIRELEETCQTLKKQLREVSARLEKENAILKQQLEFAEVEVRESKQRVKDSEEFFNLLELNEDDHRTSQHPLLRQKFSQMNELHAQQLLQKQKEIDQLVAELRQFKQNDDLIDLYSHTTSVQSSKLFDQHNLKEMKAAATAISADPSVFLVHNEDNVNDGSSSNHIAREPSNKTNLKEFNSNPFQSKFHMGEQETSNRECSGRYYSHSSQSVEQQDTQHCQSLASSDFQYDHCNNKTSSSVESIRIQLKRSEEECDLYKEEAAHLRHQKEELMEELKAFKEQQLEQQKQDEFNGNDQNAVKNSQLKMSLEEYNNMQGHIAQLQQLLLDNREAYYKERRILEVNLGELKSQHEKIEQKVEMEKKNVSTQLIREFEVKEQQIQEQFKMQIKEGQREMELKASELAEKVKKETEQRVKVEQAERIKQEVELKVKCEVENVLKYEVENRVNKEVEERINREVEQRLRMRVVTSLFKESKEDKIELDSQRKAFELETKVTKEVEERMNLEFEKRVIEIRFEAEQRARIQSESKLRAELEKKMKIEFDEKIEVAEEQVRELESEFASERHQFILTIDQLQQSLAYNNSKNQQLIQLCSQLEMEDKENELAGQKIQEMSEALMMSKQREHQLIQELNTLKEQSNQDCTSLQNTQQFLQAPSASSWRQLQQERDYLQSKLELCEAERDSLRKNALNQQQSQAKSSLPYNPYRYNSNNNNTDINSNSESECPSRNFSQQKAGNQKTNKSESFHMKVPSTISSIPTSISASQPQQYESQIFSNPTAGSNSNNNQETLPWTSAQQYLNTSQFGGNSCVLAPPQNSMMQSTILSSGASFLQGPAYHSNSNISTNGNTTNNLNQTANNFCNSSCHSNNSNQILFGSVNHSSLYGLSSAQMLEIIERAYSERLQQQQLYFEKKLNKTQSDALRKEKGEANKRIQELEKTKLINDNERLQRQVSSLKAAQENTAAATTGSNSLQDAPKTPQQILKDTAKLCEEKSLRPRSNTSSSNNTATAMTTSHVLLAKENNVINNDLDKLPYWMEGKKKLSQNENQKWSMQMGVSAEASSQSQKRSKSPLNKLFNDIEKENANLLTRKQQQQPQLSSSSSSSQKSRKSSLHTSSGVEVGSIVVARSKQSAMMMMPAEYITGNTTKKQQQLSQIDAFRLSQSNIFNTTSNQSKLSIHNSNTSAVTATSSNSTNLSNTAISALNGIRNTTPKSQMFKRSYIQGDTSTSQVFNSLTTSQSIANLPTGCQGVSSVTPGGASALSRKLDKSSYTEKQTFFTSKLSSLHASQLVLNPQ